MRDLAGRTAVITGAAGGLGLALASRCLQAGMQVALADIDPAALERACALLDERFSSQGNAPPVLMSVPTDVSDAASVHALAGHVAAHLGAVHLLVNNAGVAPMGTVWEATLADWRWAIGVNLMGVVHGLDAFLPAIRAHGEPAHILNTASVAGLISPPGMAVYNATKHAVVTLTETLAHDLAREGSPIGTSLLCPAWFASGLATAEARRPADLRNDTPPGEHRRGLEAMLGSATAAGRLSADDIAQHALDAVRENRFYVLPHPRIAPAITARAQDIVTGQTPRDPLSIGRTGRPD
jgi:NAD(P)-dependent dehydrogenase (short-subunit alcohol dehydrogenase family)